jgi:hypothetical protein
MAALHRSAFAVNAIRHDLVRIFGDLFSIEWSTVEEHPDDYVTAGGEGTRKHAAIL